MKFYIWFEILLIIIQWFIENYGVVILMIYKSFKDLRDISKPKTIEEIDEFKNDYLKEKDWIIGHIVEFPLHFLEKENLGISFFSVENIVP